MSKLRNSKLPDYTFGEELFNMISHIAGAFLGVVVITMCVARSAVRGNLAGLIGSAVYGGSMIILYTMSSVYHGLPRNTVKKVFRVLDHCTIYFLIAGTYTPITLSALMRTEPVVAWIVFGLEWGFCALSVTLTAIDMKKYKAFSMASYLVMGWCLILIPHIAVRALGIGGFTLILAGGIVYSIGAILFGIGSRVRYMHSVFHLFVLAGSLVQFIGVYTSAL